MVTPALETHLRQDPDRVRVSPLSAEVLVRAIVDGWDRGDHGAFANALILARYHLGVTAPEATC